MGPALAPPLHLDDACDRTLTHRVASQPLTEEASTSPHSAASPSPAWPRSGGITLERLKRASQGFTLDHRTTAAVLGLTGGALVSACQRLGLTTWPRTTLRHCRDAIERMDQEIQHLNQHAARLEAAARAPAAAAAAAAAATPTAEAAEAGAGGGACSPSASRPRRHMAVGTWAESVRRKAAAVQAKRDQAAAWMADFSANPCNRDPAQDPAYRTLFAKTTPFPTQSPPQQQQPDAAARAAASQACPAASTRPAATASISVDDDPFPAFSAPPMVSSAPSASRSCSACSTASSGGSSGAAAGRVSGVKRTAESAPPPATEAEADTATAAPSSQPAAQAGAASAASAPAATATATATAEREAKRRRLLAVLTHALGHNPGAVAAAAKCLAQRTIAAATAAAPKAATAAPPPPPPPPPPPAVEATPMAIDLTDAPEAPPAPTPAFVPAPAPAPAPVPAAAPAPAPQPMAAATPAAAAPAPAAAADAVASAPVKPAAASPELVTAATRLLEVLRAAGSKELAAHLQHGGQLPASAAPPVPLEPRPVPAPFRRSGCLAAAFGTVSTDAPPAPAATRASHGTLASAPLPAAAATPAAAAAAVRPAAAEQKTLSMALAAERYRVQMLEMQLCMEKERSAAQKEEVEWLRAQLAAAVSAGAAAAAGRA
ncbi:hypothetical protein HYH03_010689 [Edaphochlamys debaryana]|uniref:RWP-RK domain-containing protein n=1 Tax=Edaphochlamys debaryana TaxID=47281 RepID=A0A835XWP8_9CHLO|nr:hypothetical protein HYH03_010689 [Edaphochlamys debaryana]|eukprot:KAG2491017.1 hypothetical protein HYH03_010689 [Edaphochlamys debaryana]